MSMKNIRTPALALLLSATAMPLFAQYGGGYSSSSPAQEPTESIISPDPPGLPDPKLDREFGELKLGDVYTLLPEDLGRPAEGLPATDLRPFATMAVLHDGRLKPMDTFARHLLLQWSGKSSYEGRPAISVFADIAFAPEKTGDLQIFRIDNPDVANAIEITPRKSRLYSYREIEPSLERLQVLAARADSVEPEDRGVVEQEILRTFYNVASFLSLTRSLQFALPTASLIVALPETREALNLPDKGPTASFWELMERAPRMAAILDGISRSGDAEFSPLENEVMRLSRSMYLQSQTGSASLMLVVPDPDGGNRWLSPPEVVVQPALLQRLHALASSMAGMTEAYREGDAERFASHAEAFNSSVRELEPAMEKASFGLEVFKNRINPLFVSTVLFWIAMFAGFAYFLSRTRVLYAATWILSGTGLFLLTAEIIARIIIMRRPPVTSLFETFPFVAAVAIAIALFLERRSRQGVALLSSGMLGTLLLTIASRYATDGDTKQVLVAVLDSNFWLSTHVITITIGYAACVLSGAIAHIRLVRGAWTPNPDAATRTSLRETDRMIYGTLCFGLLFSFIGTVLGGIWADQSWGRFWGWDPKENGALLIVLWCAILLHAKQWGVIRETGMAAGAVIGAVIVSLAWQGVNLLNVGLHSYGFTSGAALKLFSYIGAEFVFLFAVWVLTLVRRKQLGIET